MNLYFFALSQYDTFNKAKDAKALRCLFIEDAAKPSLRTGAAADAVEAVMTAVNMMDATESVQFVLTTDTDKIIDTF